MPRKKLTRKKLISRQSHLAYLDKEQQRYRRFRWVGKYISPLGAVVCLVYYVWIIWAQEDPFLLGVLVTANSLVLVVFSLGAIMRFATRKATFEDYLAARGKHGK